jgi:hypothetical protein
MAINANSRAEVHRLVGTEFLELLAEFALAVWREELDDLTQSFWQWKSR